MFLDERNGRLHDLTATAATARTYVVTSTPRTGSTLLCRALWDTGRIGAPKEYLNPTQVRDWQVRLGGPAARVVHRALVGRLASIAGRGRWTDRRLRAHLDGIRARRSSEDGWFGLKLHHHHHRHWFEDPGRALHAWFPDARWVRVSREDRVGQAISWVRARQSGQWAAHRPGRGNARYSRRAIEAALRDIERGEAGWDKVLHGRDVLHLTYEQIGSDLSAAVARVLEHLGVDGPHPVPDAALERQADAETAAWRARFLSGR